MSTFDRETRQIALVWAAIAAIVFVGMLARSAVLRSRYTFHGQVIQAEVIRDSYRRNREYSLKAIGNMEPGATHVMPDFGPLYNHDTGDVIDVLALDNSIYVQPLDTLEYWASRFEVNMLAGFILLSAIAGVWVWFKIGISGAGRSV